MAMLETVIIDEVIGNKMRVRISFLPRSQLLEWMKQLHVFSEGEFFISGYGIEVNGKKKESGDAIVHISVRVKTKRTDDDLVPIFEDAVQQIEANEEVRIVAIYNPFIHHRCFLEDDSVTKKGAARCIRTWYDYLTSIWKRP